VNRSRPPILGGGYSSVAHQNMSKKVTDRTLIAPRRARAIGVVPSAALAALLAIVLWWGTYTSASAPTTSASTGLETSLGPTACLGSLSCRPSWRTN
jgi:hypothetical protein